MSPRRFGYSTKGTTTNAGDSFCASYATAVWQNSYPWSLGQLSSPRRRRCAAAFPPFDVHAVDAAAARLFAVDFCLRFFFAAVAAAVWIGLQTSPYLQAPAAFSGVLPRPENGLPEWSEVGRRRRQVVTIM